MNGNKKFAVISLYYADCNYDSLRLPRAKEFLSSCNFSESRFFLSESKKNKSDTMKVFSSAFSGSNIVTEKIFGAASPTDRSCDFLCGECGGHFVVSYYGSLRSHSLTAFCLTDYTKYLACCP